MKTLRSLLWLGLMALASAVHATTITCVTEENRPFSFLDKGKVTGFSTEVVAAVLKQTGVQGEFRVMPWARAYATAQRTENVLIFSMIRMPPREHLFKWVGVVSPPDGSYLFALRGRDIKLSNLAEARRYQIGTINGGAREQYLESRGFVKGQQLQDNAQPTILYEKLKRGRIDLWAMSERVAIDTVRQNGDDPDKVLVRALPLTDLRSDGSYMAFGPKTDDHLVDRLRKGLETVKANGTYAALLKKWF